MDDNKKRIVIITGAANGIGKAAAFEFALHDFRLTLADRDEKGLKAIAAKIEEEGGEVLVCKGDLQDLSFVKYVAEATERKWGRIDVLINNAAWRTIETMRNISIENWEKTIRICLTAPAFLSRWTAAIMEKNKEGGVILNISSIMAERAGGSSPAYIACKGALNSLSYELATLYGPAGIRVVAVCPGNINTQLSNDYRNNKGENISRKLVEEMNDNTPLKREGTAEEIAKALYWLSSPDASFITGTSIAIDGGFEHNFNNYHIKKIQFPGEF